MLLESAPEPMAVLSSPVVFSLSAVEPMAVLSEAVVLFLSAAAPTAVFRPPCVHKERSKTNGHVEVAAVVGERFRPNGHVLESPVVLL